jgi:carboxyl-terminal processing protease
MIREKSGKVVSLKDMNRGTIYDGPMTLLVNSQSASASELLGAVLQDYNRAVVIGSTSFGKGTAQVIFPLDTSDLPLASRNTEYGFVKITTSKFYRVNGMTTQHIGVVPDVILPDIFDGMNYHEAALPTALPSDTIKKNSYYKPLPALPLTSIAEKSRARISSDKQFELIRKYSRMIKDTVKILEEDLENTQKVSQHFTVNANAFDAGLLKRDSYLAEINNNWIDKISKDIYIEEAYNILTDLINYHPK